MTARPPIAALERAGLPRGRRAGDRRRADRRRADAWARRLRHGGRVLVALAVALVALRVAWPAAVVATPRTEVRALFVGGRTRTFRLHHPARWDPEQPLPLVLAFHGHAGSGRVLEFESRLDESADAAGALVAYPDGVPRWPALARVPLVGAALAGLSRTWNVGACCAPASDDRVDDVAFAAAVVRTLDAERSADPARVVATGFSIGGTLALRLACDRPALVTAVVSVEGTMPDTTCAAGRPVPVWLVRGGEDAELRADLAENRDQGGRYAAAESMRAAFAFWGRRAGCRGPVVRRPGPRVTTSVSADCSAGPGVSEVLVHGNPHAWPGGRRPWLFAPAPVAGVPLAAWVVGLLARPARPASR